MRTYDPRDVSLIVNSHIASGFAEGTFISTAKDEENYTTYVGAQGEVSRARNAHPVGSITCTLKSTSPSNAVFNALAKSRETFAAQVIDRNTGNTSVGGSICWFEKPADREWGDEVTEVEWTIIVADYDQEIN